MRILFLDDDPIRHKYFQEWSIGHVVSHAMTIEGFGEFLKEGEFDLVFLDHDLGGAYLPDTAGRTGQDAARILLQSLGDDDNKWPRVVTHSYNPEGAKAIQMLLADAGIACPWVPFGLELQKWL